MAVQRSGEAVGKRLDRPDVSKLAGDFKETLNAKSADAARVRSAQAHPRPGGALTDAGPARSSPSRSSPAPKLRLVPDTGGALRDPPKRPTGSAGWESVAPEKPSAASLAKRGLKFAARALAAAGVYFSMTGPAGTERKAGTVPGRPDLKFRQHAESERAELVVHDPAAPETSPELYRGRPGEDGIYRTAEGVPVARLDPTSANKPPQFDKAWLASLPRAGEPASGGKPERRPEVVLSAPHTQQALPPLGTAPHERRQANQTCTNARLDELQNLKDNICKFPGQSCNPKKFSAKTLDRRPCSEIRQRIQSYRDCTDIRNQIQDECYGGVPDARHATAMSEIQSGLKHCEALEAVNCKPGHPMANK